MIDDDDWRPAVDRDKLIPRQRVHDRNEAHDRRQTDLFVERTPFEWTADISACERYRYELTRRWSFGESIAFLMLNPSTADAKENDPTIRRCIGYARARGGGQLVVGNIFALRATDPEVMLAHPEPVGPRNDSAIIALAKAHAWVLCAWGKHGAHRGRALEVLKILRAHGCEPRCLAMNKDGSPGHPLYLRADLVPVPYRGAA